MLVDLLKVTGYFCSLYLSVGRVSGTIAMPSKYLHLVWSCLKVGSYMVSFWFKLICLQ